MAVHHRSSRLHAIRSLRAHGDNGKRHGGTLLSLITCHLAFHMFPCVCVCVRACVRVCVILTWSTALVLSQAPQVKRLCASWLEDHEETLTEFLVNKKQPLPVDAATMQHELCHRLTKACTDQSKPEL